MSSAPDIRSEPDAGRRRRPELNVAQVAGSAVAAVVAAVFASRLGVYGTILGAGVVSAVATFSGSVLQHFFRRSGERLRGAAVRMRPQPAVSEGPPRTGEFGEGTLHRARIRGVRRPLPAAALVFVVVMGGITAFEAASGHVLGGGSGTTVGDLVTGTGGSSGHSSGGDGTPATTPSHAPADGTDGVRGQTVPDGGATSGTSTGTDKDGSGSRTGTSAPTPAPTGTDSGGTGPDDGGTAPGSGSGSGSTGSGPDDRTPAPTPTSTGGDGTAGRQYADGG